MKKYTWSNKEDDELWQNSEFDTKEQCIEDGACIQFTF